MQQQRQQGDTAHPIMIDIGDDGATVLISISKNGSPFIAANGNVVSVGSGYFSFTPHASDLDTIGTATVVADATHPDTTTSKVETQISVVSFDPFSDGDAGAGGILSDAELLAKTKRLTVDDTTIEFQSADDQAKIAAATKKKPRWPFRMAKFRPPAGS